jgi:hypothetical protein
LAGALTRSLENPPYGRNVDNAKVREKEKDGTIKRDSLIILIIMPFFF